VPTPSATVPRLLPVPSPTSSAGTPISTPSAPPVDIPGAVASRIRIESLNVDLPIVSGTLVVPGNRDLYPLCDVAMSLDGFVAPGMPGATYLYAHAQQGMFLPLLRASEIDDGAAMIGARIEVFSADAKVHVYEIVRVKRHATDLSLAAVAPGQHQLVLQTSEGATGTVPKLQIAARPVTVADVTPEEANPVPQPRVCLPG